MCDAGLDIADLQDVIKVVDIMHPDAKAKREKRKITKPRVAKTERELGKALFAD
jgi:hypothetical protein